jgi:hypothetical protein
MFHAYVGAGWALVQTHTYSTSQLQSGIVLGARAWLSSPFGCPWGLSQMLGLDLPSGLGVVFCFLPLVCAETSLPAPGPGSHAVCALC